MDELIQRITQTIEDLGIADREALAPYVQQWDQRPPSNETSDEEMEVAKFLTLLFQAKVINRTQGRTLLGMLSGNAGPARGDPNVGRRYAGFVAEELVGEGAMGKVYRASQEGTLSRDFVIKLFSKSDDKKGLSRFRREGQVMSGLDHSNIVKVATSGEDQGQPYLVLEYVDGPTLQELLEKRGRFGWQSASRAVKQIASALAAAHEQGVIHRDIKPSNVLVGPGGVLKVFDFGLAKLLDSKAASQAGMILGSPAYMAPEQWGDHAVDERVDLFALGVVYYALVSGRVPFRARTPAEYATAIQAGRYDPLDQVQPGTPPGVCHIVGQLLETDRTFRYPSARAVVADLDRLLKGREPNVPRLEAADAGAEPASVALVGTNTFTVGSAERATIRFADLAPQHAEIERSTNGFLLRDLGTEAGTRVAGNRVREIVLRDKDTVQFGNGALYRFSVGNLTTERATTRFGRPSDRFSPVADASVNAVGPAAEPPAAINGLLCDALLDAAHPRVIQACIENLDPYGTRLRLNLSGKALVDAGFDKDDVRRFAERARELAQDHLSVQVDKLFSQTKENLGLSYEAWLSWWFEARTQFPQQLCPPGPRVLGRVNVMADPKDDDGDPVDLVDGEQWTVGRADDADVTVPHRSVSRQHVVLYRFNARYGFRDLGSRFGTVVGESRRELGFLRDGDVLKLGHARVRYEEVPLSPVPGQDPIEVDRFLFQAMVESRAPATALSLIRLLNTGALADFCVHAAAPHEDFMTVGALVMDFLDRQRALALEALPAITRANFGDDPNAWLGWWNENAANFGPQVQPAGWAS